MGFIAQDLEATLPKEFQNLVQTIYNYRGEDSKTVKAIDYTVYTTILHEVVNTQQTKIQLQETKIKSLEDRLSEIELKLSKL